MQQFLYEALLICSEEGSSCVQAALDMLAGVYDLCIVPYGEC